MEGCGIRKGVGRERGQQLFLQFSQIMLKFRKKVAYIPFLIPDLALVGYVRSNSPHLALRGQNHNFHFRK